MIQIIKNFRTGFNHFNCTIIETPIKFKYGEMDIDVVDYAVNNISNINLKQNNYLVTSQEIVLQEDKGGSIPYKGNSCSLSSFIRASIDMPIYHTKFLATSERLEGIEYSIGILNNYLINLKDNTIICKPICMDKPISGEYLSYTHLLLDPCNSIFKDLSVNKFLEVFARYSDTITVLKGTFSDNTAIEVIDPKSFYTIENMEDTLYGTMSHTDPLRYISIEATTS